MIKRNMYIVVFIIESNYNVRTNLKYVLVVIKLIDCNHLRYLQC